MNDNDKLRTWELLTAGDIFPSLWTKMDCCHPDTVVGELLYDYVKEMHDRWDEAGEDDNGYHKVTGVLTNCITGEKYNVTADVCAEYIVQPRVANLGITPAGNIIAPNDPKTALEQSNLC